MTIEADLCRELKISWADARDLASYARRKLNIIPGDATAEQTHRQSIFTTAIEAANRGEREQNDQNLNSPEQHYTPDRQEHVMAVQDASIPKSNGKDANEAAEVDGTTQTKTDHKPHQSGCLCFLDCLFGALLMGL